MPDNFKISGVWNHVPIFPESMSLITGKRTEEKKRHIPVLGTLVLARFTDLMISCETDGYETLGIRE